MALHFVEYDISIYETNINKFEAELKKFQDEFVDKFVSHCYIERFLNQPSLCEQKILKFFIDVKITASDMIL